MSKITGYRVPVATHTDKMFQKINSTNNRNDSSLPTIAPSGKQRPQNRLTRLSSSSSFLLRLMSIEEHQDRDKSDRKNGPAAGQTRKNHVGIARQLSQDFIKGTSFGQGHITGNTHEANSDSSQEDISRLLPLSNDEKNPNNLISPDESSPIRSYLYDNNNTNTNTNLFPSNENAGNMGTDFSFMDHPSVNEKPLKLPPLLLPPIHSVRPRPLKERDFLRPTRIRGPINDREWEELLQCRYIRHATPRYALKWTPSKSYIHHQ